MAYVSKIIHLIEPVKECAEKGMTKEQTCEKLGINQERLKYVQQYARTKGIAKIVFSHHGEEIMYVPIEEKILIDDAFTNIEAFKIRYSMWRKAKGKEPKTFLFRKGNNFTIITKPSKTQVVVMLSCGWVVNDLFDSCLTVEEVARKKHITVREVSAE